MRTITKLLKFSTINSKEAFKMQLTRKWKHPQSLVLFFKEINRHVKCPTPHYALSGGFNKSSKKESDG